ncbi:MAG: MoaD/ThiS family protein [Pirellulales bacterium]|jgi:molybdopterin synthase sulfur carrier subunit
MVQIFIPAQLRAITKDVANIELDVSSLGELITQLQTQYPGIRDRLCEGDRIRATIQVSIDGTLTSQGMLAKIPPNCEVHFLPAMGGG